jgi:hypothetical protein
MEYVDGTTLDEEVPTPTSPWARTTTGAEGLRKSTGGAAISGGIDAATDRCHLAVDLGQEPCMGPAAGTG